MDSSLHNKDSLHFLENNIANITIRDNKLKRKTPDEASSHEEQTRTKPRFSQTDSSLESSINIIETSYKRLQEQKQHMSKSSSNKSVEIANLMNLSFEETQMDHTQSLPTPGRSNNPDDTYSQIIKAFKTNAFQTILDQQMEKTLASSKLENIIKTAVENAVVENINPLQEQSNRHEISINKIEDRIEIIEQRDRITNLLISGIPQPDNPPPSIRDKIKKITDHLGINLSDEEILAVYRIPNGQVMLKLTNLKKREEIFSKRVQLKSYPEGVVFINEDLTPYMGKLFLAVREKVKKLKLYTCFTRSGIPFIKKSESDRPTRITTLAELQEKFPDN